MQLVIILTILLITTGFAVWYTVDDTPKSAGKLSAKAAQKKKVTFSPDLKKEYYQNFNEHVRDAEIKYIDKILPYEINSPKKYEVPIEDIPPFRQPIQGLPFNAEYQSTLKPGCNYM